MSLLFPDLLFRLNVASLGGGESASDARSMLKGDLDLYADQNRNLAQLLELNEKKNKYLLQVIDEIQNKPKESQALVPVVNDSSQAQVTVTSSLRVVLTLLSYLLTSHLARESTSRGADVQLGRPVGGRKVRPGRSFASQVLTIKNNMFL